MTTREYYRHFLLKIQAIYQLSEATVIADMVFEQLAGIKRSDFIKDPAKPISTKIKEGLDQALAELLTHKPVQYVLGTCWFHHLKFKVNEAVLIPRPETEELVSHLIEDYKNNIYRVNQPSTKISRDQLRILDIGTGSGCIPVSLKKNLAGAEITAIDISDKALDIARENAETHHVDIQFIELDFLDESSWETQPVFDIIISNPPYIPFAEKDKLDKNVTDFEPHRALFVPDKDPLLFYGKIARFGKTHLAENGRIYLEAHADYTHDVAVVLKTYYADVKVIKDMQGRDRMIIAGY